MKISENQRKVLEYMVENGDGEGRCFYFRTIAKNTKITIREVRLACRALARKGFAEFHKGLFDDDGMVAGSGTTGVACKNLGRNFILIEKDPTYIEIIKNRLAPLQTYN